MRDQEKIFSSGYRMITFNNPKNKITGFFKKQNCFFHVSLKKLHFTAFSFVPD